MSHVCVILRCVGRCILQSTMLPMAVSVLVLHSITVPPACGQAAGAPRDSTQVALPPAASTPSVVVPGIPNRPDLVTVVPFYSKADETDREKTKVVIPVEIDGRHGIVILDLGATPTMLNRTFLQPKPTGGVDTVTDATSIPDSTPMDDYLHGDLQPFAKAHVTVRLGTLLSTFDDSSLTRNLQQSDPHRYNVALGHLWGNFGWVFAPRLGNIGPAVLAPFETIIDYPHQRVILIRLDAAGHRMADVPAYTPKWTAPLVPIPLPRLQHFSYLGLAVRPGNTLDTLTAANNTEVKILDTGAPESGNQVLGYDFLRTLGVFGINQRTHQFMLYH
jgi:hypothetical protein